MPSLSRDLRRLLEKTIAGENGARQIAEDGAERSLQRLAVDKHEPHTSLTLEERTLRNQLRAHGRQLGDKRDPQRGTQTITHLKQAVAYEHWHRLLFARFLAENDLLLHPEHGVALSLDEVKELALRDKQDWIEVAADFAQRMLLSAVFRPEDPILRVPLPAEKRLELEKKLNSLPREVFLANDSLGWVYQFWQKDAKDEVNRSEVKIGADELASVTQLFTEDYMVLFLLENMLGAWWTSRHGSPELPGYAWTYLRLNDDGTPTAGAFDAWPKTGKELRVFDPCMGSGHFLTFALPILTCIRAAEENLGVPDAIFAVLRDNLFGLELDARCSQIAAFNIALTAWKLAGGHFELPPLNLACSGLGINAKEEDWLELAGNDGRARETMRKLFKMFSDAPTLGSLIDPSRLGATLFVAEFSEVRPLLEKALAAERTTEDARELAIAAQGLVSAARLLADRFTLVATNVPYLGRGKQDDILKEHCETFYGDAKADLATCFVERSMRLCNGGGSIALVTPQSWLFLPTYKKLRERLLKREQWDFVARLGPRAFETITGEVVSVALLALTHVSPLSGTSLAGWDVSSTATPEAKAQQLKSLSPTVTPQSELLLTPDARVVIGHSHGPAKLSEYATSFLGLGTGDYSHYGRVFWEFPSLPQGWAFQQGSVDISTPWGGREHLVAWDSSKQRVRGMSDEEKEQIHNQDQSGQQAWGQSGVAVGLSRELRATLYTGDKFDKAVAVLIPRDEDLIPALWTFCTSPEFNRLVRELDQKVIVANGTLTKVSFDLAQWKATATAKYPDGLPKPFSSDPSQWLFGGHPKSSENPLQVAVARLLGFHWPRQRGCCFPGCPETTPDGLETVCDSTGIVCIPSVLGEETAGARLRSVLQAAYGSDYNLAQLLKSKRSDTLDGWLRTEFFEEHCRVFHDRPFIWHVWDGLNDGFHALVNYHKLDHECLEKLIYSYLGDWIMRRRQDLAHGIEGADTQVAAAEHLQAELKKILEGEAPYDIFARWKPLKEQPIGWHPDLNDGVRMNIRPWIAAASLYRSTKPGLLRTTPNIKYTKDRGKEPYHQSIDFPWFNNSKDRINDHHLTLKDKTNARGTQ